MSSRIGIVLVTRPCSTNCALIEALRAASSEQRAASSEPRALLSRNLLVPVMNGVTFEELNQVSPTLASRGGFCTAEESMRDIVVKIAELVGTLEGE